jgi:hypothetical protein
MIGRELDVEALKKSLRYERSFRALLESVAANSLNRDPILGAAEFSLLYTPEEVVSAINAAEEAALSIEEAVGYFIFLTAAARADAQKRKGLFQRLKTKIEPRPGTVEYSHIAMTNYALNVLLEGQLDQEKGRAFADRYSQRLAGVKTES